ncbi:DUF2771 domain-containing protein [Streptomyces sparsus]
MTSMLSGGRGRRAARTAIAAGAVSLGLIALSACEKPTPRVTAVAGSTSVSTEAACYDDGKNISEQRATSCAERKPTETLTVGEGDMLRLGVEPEIAETGWVLFLNGQQAISEPITGTYRSFQSDAFFQQQSPMGGPGEKASSVNVSIAEFDGKNYKGVWNIKLKSGS